MAVISDQRSSYDTGSAMDEVTHPEMVKVEVAGVPAENNRCITRFDRLKAAGVIRGTT